MASGATRTHPRFGFPEYWGCHWADIEHRLGHRLAPDHAAPCFRSNLIRYDIDAVFVFFVVGPWDRQANWISRLDAEAGWLRVSTGGWEAVTAGDPRHRAGGPAWQVVPKGGGAPYRFAGTLPTMVPVSSCLGGR